MSWAMLAFGGIAVLVTLERAWFFATTCADLPELARALRSDLGAALVTLQASRSSLTSVLVAGLSQATRGAVAAEHAMVRAGALHRLRLEARLWVLLAVAFVAPLLGFAGA